MAINGNGNERQYSQELLETVIDLVKSGQIGLKKASRDFDIPYSTLGEKIRGRRPVKALPKFLLLPEEEDKLVMWLKVHAERAMTWMVDDLKRKVKEILEL